MGDETPIAPGRYLFASRSPPGFLFQQVDAGSQDVAQKTQEQRESTLPGVELLEVVRWLGATVVRSLQNLTASERQMFFVQSRAQRSGISQTEPAALEVTLRAFAERKGVKPAALIHATRVAVTGRAASPGLFEVIVLVGRDRAVRRMDGAVALFG